MGCSLAGRLGPPPGEQDSEEEGEVEAQRPRKKVKLDSNLSALKCFAVITAVISNSPYLPLPNPAHASILGDSDQSTSTAHSH